MGPDVEYTQEPRALRSSIGSISNAVAREKAAIESIMSHQDLTLNLTSDLVDQLFVRFAPVLSNQEQVSKASEPDNGVYGSSELFRGLDDQYRRTSYINEKIRTLLSLAEV
jgi:hypothetical protein